MREMYPSQQHQLLCFQIEGEEKEPTCELKRAPGRDKTRVRQRFCSDPMVHRRQKSNPKTDRQKNINPPVGVIPQRSGGNRAGRRHEIARVIIRRDQVLELGRGEVRGQEGGVDVF